MPLPPFPDFEMTFIWTMWDIKVFYYNLPQWQVVPFIWTMWDIKSLNTSPMLLPLTSFIWTMWDIKRLYTAIPPPGESFHLNHVGYKGWKSSLMKTSFWDFHLNHVGYKVVVIAIVLFKKKITFIWTMWDIKQSLIALGILYLLVLSSEPCGI